MNNVWMTRTTHGILAPCRGTATCPADRYVFTIALKDANIAFSDARGIVLQGRMIAGTLYVAAPAQEMKVAFSGPCDLLHLSVLNSHVEEQRALAGLGPKSNRRALDRLVMRDPVIGQLGNLLGDASADWPAAQVDALGQLVISRLLRLLQRQESRSPLPLWRLRKVETLIERDIAAPLRLKDLAEVAGLSRMHFAAQFRVATGYRPHEYVLMRRIEHAKTLMARNELSLVAIALDAGFQSQAHFCTIFKRITGATPSGWRQQRRAPKPSPKNFVARAEPTCRVEPAPMGARFSPLHARPNDRAAVHAA